MLGNILLEIKLAVIHGSACQNQNTFFRISY